MRASKGTGDCDLVLSVDELVSCIECLADQCPPTIEKLPIVELKRTSSCQDMRVGERASKRRRTAGVAAQEHSGLSMSTQRIGRSGRYAASSLRDGSEKPMSAGYLPKGWKVHFRIIGDGRRCKYSLSGVEDWVGSWGLFISCQVIKLLQAGALAGFAVFCLVLKPLCCR
jgi:hypothetical protein